MSHRTTARTIIALVGAAGVLALPSMAAVAAATNDDSQEWRPECGYAADVVTATDLTLDRTSIAPGETTTAWATVSSGAGVPPGEVSFQVAGRSASTVPLTAGMAEYAIPSDLAVGAYTVTATYVPPVCWLPSSDTVTLNVVAEGVVPPPDIEPDEAPTVKPAEGERPDVVPAAGGGGVPPARTAPTFGFLPSTGAGAALTWTAAGGLVLLTAGGAVLLTRRQRRGTP